MKMLAELNSLTPDAVDALTQALRDHADALREATRVTRAEQALRTITLTELAELRNVSLNVIRQTVEALGIQVFGGKRGRGGPASISFADAERLTARMGQRREFINIEGDIDHELICGLFHARTYREGTDLGFVGAARSLVSGWEERPDSRGESLTETSVDFPTNSPAALKINEYDLMTNGMSFGQRLSDGDCQVYVTGVLRNTVNEAVSDAVRELI